MRRFREIIGCLLTFAAWMLGLYLLLVFCVTVPNSAIRVNMYSSAKLFLDTEPYAFPEDGSYRAVADNYADQIWTNIAWHMGEGEPFSAALDTSYYDGGGFGMSRGLFRSLTEKQPANTDYIRYWHGTAGLIRLFHLFTDVQGIRNFGMLAMMLLAALVVWMLYRRGHWDLALCLLLSMVSVQLGNLRLSMEYLPCFVIAFAMCAVFLIREERSERSLPRLSVVAGVLTAYFDFLTTETVTILLPLILVISVRAKERRLRDRRRTVRLILRCLFWWAAAYAGAFAVKWWAASLVTGENQFLAALSAAGNRVSGNFRELEEGKSPNAWRSIMANLSVLFGAKKRIDYGKILLGLVLSGGAGYYLFRNHRRKRLCVHGPEFLLLLGAVVLIRYGVLANHAYLHSFFTYRALICPVMAVLVSLRLNLRLDGRGGQ